MEEAAQLPKVEQTDIGEVLAFPSRPYLSSVTIPAPKPKKGTSPNKGHAATGRSREHLTISEVEQLLEKARRPDATRTGTTA